MHEEEPRTHIFNGREYPCCASLTMGVIGKKWKMVILFHLIDGKLRYNELRKEMPTVTERTLSLQLKSLEEDGIIQRKVLTECLPKVPVQPKRQQLKLLIILLAD